MNERCRRACRFIVDIASRTMRGVDTRLLCLSPYAKPALPFDAADAAPVRQLPPLRSRHVYSPIRHPRVDACPPQRAQSASVRIIKERVRDYVSMRAMRATGFMLAIYFSIASLPIFATPEFDATPDSEWSMPCAPMRHAFVFRCRYEITAA